MSHVNTIFLQIRYCQNGKQAIAHNDNHSSWAGASAMFLALFIFLLLALSLYEPGLY